MKRAQKKLIRQVDESYHAGVLHVLASEMISELAWRLPLICLLTGSAVLGTAVFFEMKERIFGICWLAIACIEAFFHLCMFRQTNPAKIHFYAGITAIGTFLWWALMPAFSIGSQIFSEIILLLLMLGLGTLPWPRFYNLALTGMFALVALVHLPFSAYPPIYALAVIVVAFTAIRTSSVSYLSFMSRSLMPVLAKACESLSSVVATVRLLAWNMALIADVERVLIAFGQTKTNLIVKGRAQRSSVDPVFVRGLTQKAEEQGLQEGIIKYELLGEQYINPLLDWFGFIPKSIYFASLQAVINDKEQKIVVFVPLSISAIMVRTERVRRTLIGMSAAVRLSLSATRSRFLSSDVLLAKEQSISEKDYEFNELIHLVNNVAQDISIISEQTKDLVLQESKNNHTDQNAESQTDYKSLVLEEIRQLEGLVRYLAAGASDIKWLKELARIDGTVRVETVPLAPLLEELKIYAFYRSERRGENLQFSSQLDPSLAVEVASREFLEASLRLLLRIASRRLKEKKQLSFKAYQNESEVVFEIADSGTALDSKTKKKLLSGWSRFSHGNSLEHLVKGVLNLAKASGGKLEFRQSSEEFENTISLALKASVVKDIAKVEDSNSSMSVRDKDQWVLLVDDKLQITTFYARVADALELPNETAASVEEALGIVDRRGMPCLVVTDIELGSGSGLDLVTSLRERYGRELPIIVVSGHTEEGLAEKVFSVGATKYLTKPLGRRKLFAEINEILGQ